MSYNPGLLFYKHYYERFDFAQMLLDNNSNVDKKIIERREKAYFKPLNTILLLTPFVSNLLLPIEKSKPALGAAPVRLTTTYPGLVIGTGYTHGIGATGEFKIGFYFDHTTGLPVIPGSSVKGLLRSAFPVLYWQKAEQLRKKGKTEEAEFWDGLAENRKQFVEALLKALNIEPDKKANFVQRLELEIFEGMQGLNREKAADHFSMSDRDIFYEAVIVDSKSRFIFEDEYITPHKNKKGDGIPDELKNPTPLQLLKVRPGVTFEFQFDLKNTYRLPQKEDEQPNTVERLLKPEQRRELFRQILLFLGSGAKTNTGFGHFEAEGRKNLSEIVENQPSDEAPDTTKQTPPELPKLQAKSGPMLKFDRKLSGNKNAIGEIIKVEGEKGYFKLVNVEGYDKEIEITHIMMPRFSPGDQFSFSIGKVDPDLKQLSAQISVYIPLKQKFHPNK